MSGNGRGHACNVAPKTDPIVLANLRIDQNWWQTEIGDLIKKLRLSESPAERSSLKREISAASAELNRINAQLKEAECTLPPAPRVVLERFYRSAWERLPAKQFDELLRIAQGTKGQ
jgi:hypothetical protein